jgi:phospholipid/cholesterol/gamma-HCH transport system permease protein
MLLSLSGDWTARSHISRAPAPELLLKQSDVQAILFDSSNLGRWDSSLLIFLSSLREASRQRHIVFDQTGLPAAARLLLAMLPEAPQAPVATRPRIGLIARLGDWAIERWSESVALTSLVGEAAMRTVPALRGKARVRTTDLLTFIQDASVAALPTVALVNILIGAIVAFVGGIELRQLGAEVYVSNLVGVAVVREMTPLVTAIVMSGRTGSAYAAEIAAMQGSEEIEALRALGIPIFDYLILPRVAALSLMMPLLCTYAGALGVLGGFTVAVAMLHVSAGAFLAHLRAVLTASDFVLGLTKSIAFGSWIAIGSCQIGLSAGRSATDVGHAATTAAVRGIVGVIALDALFDLCANALGI